MKNIGNAVIFIILVTVTFFTAVVNAQQVNTRGDVYSSLSPGIEVDDLHQLISFLASDSLKGRKPGMPEERVAAQYISDMFRHAGLRLVDGNGLQLFSIVADVIPGKSNSFGYEGELAEMGKDFQPVSFSANASLSASVAFVGFGFDLALDSLVWNDYDGIDVKGKWVIIFRGDPEPSNNNSVFLSYSQDRSKVLTAKDKGAAGVLLVTPVSMEKTDILMSQHYDKTPSDAGIPVFNITRALADRLLSSMNYSCSDLETTIIDNHNPSSILVPVTVNATADLVRVKVPTANVIGIVKGNDPVLSEEYIVIGAHYDHLGLGGENSGSRVPDEHAVHNGADDNASGTAGVLELAHKLQKNADLLKRSIVLVAFAGEEMGLLGSKEFIRNPPVPLKNIKAMINMDMIGRLHPETKAVSIGGTGTSTESEALLSDLAKGRTFVTRHSPDGYGPSDHAPFYSENIPVFYFTTGAHEDYHTPGDDIEKLDLQGEKAILEFIYDLAVQLASRDQNLAFREAGSKQGARYGRNMKVTLGIVPDMVSGDNKGLRVDGVRKGGPAETAGIMKGDVVVAIDGQVVTNIYDYMARLGKIKPGQVASVEIMRSGVKEVVIVQF